MEIDYFSLKKSSSGEYYFKNKITGETQWGDHTYFKIKKRLPEGWIRLDYNAKRVYKYIGDKIGLTSSHYYSPTLDIQKSYEDLDEEERAEAYRKLDLFKKVASLVQLTPESIWELQKSYEDLDEKDKKESVEAYRRLDLFKKVAKSLQLTPDSIWDESLEFLAGKADVPVKKIIAYIEETERRQLGKKAFLTPFSIISKTAIHFSSERSIRELCGVNMKKVEASNALKEMEDLCCPIRGTIFKEPFVCSSGHTFERDAIRQWLLTGHRTCPIAKSMNITTYIAPNHALRTILHSFVEKYEHQRGHNWKPIVDACLEFKNFSGTSFAPEDVIEELNEEAMRQRNIPRSEVELREYFTNMWADNAGYSRAIDRAVDMTFYTTGRTYNDAERISLIILEQEGLLPQ